MTEKKQDQDTLQRFIFEKQQVRGVLVHLNATYKAALENHEYNTITAKLTGEMLCVAALLASTIKFKGKLTLQAQGNGPLKVLLAQVNDLLQLRGLAIYEGKIKGNFKKLMGDGHLLININPDDAKERYQAITEISGESLASTIEHYFKQSEQLATRLWIFSTRTKVAGLLLQAMPGEAEDNHFWEHATTLAQTITASELLNLSNTTILHRLFHEEDVRLFEREPVCFCCNCSTEKMEMGLLQLGRAEAEDILKEEKVIKVTCDFCNRQYNFDQVDVARIFASGNVVSGDDLKQ